MKHTPRFAAIALLLSTAVCLAQGSLTPPPGPPTATMKTLDQVEARIPLVAGQPGVSISEAGTITIGQPGSYYLTKSVTIASNVNGMEINADATVDLNGYSIIGTTADITTANAIVIGQAVNVTLGNGSIKGGTTLTNDAYTVAGFLNGVLAEYPAANLRSSIKVHDLTITGMRQTGILIYRFSTVERCTVQGVRGSGIRLVNWPRPDSPSFDPRIQGFVRDSHASDCGGQFGIAATSVTRSFGHTSLRASDYADAPCGIVAVNVEDSTGWATGAVGLGFDEFLYGIHATLASHSVGRGPNGTSTAIRASTALGCVAQIGIIEATKSLP